jgi:hypothetical protein
MRHLIVAIFILFAFQANSQSTDKYKAADIIALNAPDSCQATVEALGKYFSAAFKDQSLRARAIFTWTAMKISYDVANMGKAIEPLPIDELVDKTFRTRIAVCQGYASVFKTLCDICGIKAYIVNGYTRQNGHINDISHAWVIALIDSSYVGFDPTWGGGYLNNGRFVKQFNEQYFMIKPEVLIKDHMPFDPMWECLNYPIGNLDFNFGKTVPSAPVDYFSYADSIDVYQNLEPKVQCQRALLRLEAAGQINNQIRDWAAYLRECIENEQLNTAATKKNGYVVLFNDAVASYNNCIYAFNQYVEYWNRQFTPSKSDASIAAMLQVCYDYLDSCNKTLALVVAGDPDMKQSTDQLKLAIDVARDNMDKQKVFLKIYFNTDAVSRPNLFKHYNAAGFPKTK